MLLCSLFGAMNACHKEPVTFSLLLWSDCFANRAFSLHHGQSQCVVVVIYSTLVFYYCIEAKLPSIYAAKLVFHEINTAPDSGDYYCSLTLILLHFQVCVVAYHTVQDFLAAVV